MRLYGGLPYKRAAAPDKLTGITPLKLKLDKLPTLDKPLESPYFPKPNKGDAEIKPITPVKVKGFGVK